MESTVASRALPRQLNLRFCSYMTRFRQCPHSKRCLQDSQDSSYSHSCKEAHLICSQLVLQQQPKHFRWSLQPRHSTYAKASDGRLPCASESEAVVDIDHDLLQRLPLLADISRDIELPRTGGNGACMVSATRTCAFTFVRFSVLEPMHYSHALR